MAHVIDERAAYAGLRVTRGAQLHPTPWKNGGGMTRELAVHPPGAGFDDFIWRVSVADIEQSGPFSRFAGIDRTLVLLAGAGMHLVDGRGVAHAALDEPFAFARFPGELALTADLIDGPTRDLNVMLRRDSVRSTSELWQGAGAHVLDADAVVIFCARGTLEVTIAGAEPMRLDAMDALHIDAPSRLPCVMAGRGTAIAVGLCCFEP
jgi:environmental stress-induced protein Ves